ncbi:anthranilate synthase component I family protein [Pontibacter akesuensis]|uniref:Para-aminobenzoate synthetase component 1 n=1 Tax=Pontibacter akesuensis TaxID=388950 RepID=A0A1I7G662_9BACT|nr:anthranilate synthase component I family protein [Pontibacter akesuensis]GHA58640.1 para-aminobenzoate synthase [Pontibacter akesuensis]SFU43841.1 para-aminobenzoate synthetase component 1 [Pontibacter akesuensis]
MMCKTEIFAADLPVSLEELRLKALAWADAFPLVAYYNSNNIPYPHQGFMHLLAVSAGEVLELEQGAAFESLRHELQQHPLLCGYLTYDLKNQIEKLHSNNTDHLGFPLLTFFMPQVYVYFNTKSITIYTSADNEEAVLAAILSSLPPVPAAPVGLEIKQRVSKNKYKEQVEQIRQHILEGDVYELNYCMEFYAEQVQVQPLALYLALNEASPTPFSGYLKLQDKYLLCASPERFLKKEGQKLISQPIKGTIQRGQTPAEDEQLQQQLRHDEKELAENMMIVDLVRNDLSRSCATGTVQVEEMFGIYGFRQVSQMISTVVGELKPEKNLVDALIGTFPMGSMTGAPKISALQLIEALEDTKRGLYSGAFGYITDTGDCDFNVVIRSMQYNASNGYLSFMVGSAITYDSDPEREYEECLLKAQAILKVLGAGNYV